MIYVFILLVVLFGNIFFIIVFLSVKDFMMFFIVNMVVFDLLMVIFLILCVIIREIIRFSVFFVYGSGGVFLCKMCIFFSDMLLVVLI